MKGQEKQERTDTSPLKQPAKNTKICKLRHDLSGNHSEPGIRHSVPFPTEKHSNIRQLPSKLLDVLTFLVSLASYPHLTPTQPHPLATGETSQIPQNVASNVMTCYTSCVTLGLHNSQE